MPTDPLLVAKLAPVVLDNAPVTASPVVSTESLSAPPTYNLKMLVAEEYN